jgi:dihydropteroate synthase
VVLWITFCVFSRSHALRCRRHFTIFVVMSQTVRDQAMVFRFGDVSCDFAARTHIMGVLNVTPDSFSDGGRYLDPDRALDRALEMQEAGADFIDVGGESTRPRSGAYGEGAEAVTVEEETRRVLPVLQRLVPRIAVPLSIDTTKSEVARLALDAGASIVNDISGFGFDPAMPATVARANASAIVMHMQGTPRTMQADPRYTDILAEVETHLRTCVERGRQAGIRQIVVDPGIGFGKRLQDNLTLVRGLARFHRLGCPVMVGPSRKAFLGDILGLPVDDRLEGTLAAVVAAILSGAHMVRVHDVRQVKRAALVADALRTHAL